MCMAAVQKWKPEGVEELTTKPQPKLVWAGHKTFWFFERERESMVRAVVRGAWGLLVCILLFLLNAQFIPGNTTAIVLT